MWCRHIERLAAARRTRLEARLGTWADTHDARLVTRPDKLAHDLFNHPEHRHRILTGTQRST